ncbi:MAG: hypothetical protein P8N92_07980, partial [Burkholderiales bacterium]|nr:hypothetical protein [Burkholderiales bacterium]
HSSFYAALDTEIRTAKHRQHDIKVTCGKQKDAPEFNPMQFMKVSTRNSIILEETDLEQRPAQAKLGKNDRIALDAFEAALGFCAQFEFAKTGTGKNSNAKIAYPHTK